MRIRRKEANVVEDERRGICTNAKRCKESERTSQTDSIKRLCTYKRDTHNASPSALAATTFAYQSGRKARVRAGAKREGADMRH